MNQFVIIFYPVLAENSNNEYWLLASDVIQAAALALIECRDKHGLQYALTDIKSVEQIIV